MKQCCLDAIRSFSGSKRTLELELRPMVRKPDSRSKICPAKVPDSILSCNFIRPIIGNALSMSRHCQIEKPAHGGPALAFRSLVLRYRSNMLAHVEIKS